MVMLARKPMRTAMPLSALLFLLSVAVENLAEMRPFGVPTSHLALLVVIAALTHMAMTYRKLVSVDSLGSAESRNLRRWVDTLWLSGTKQF